MSTHTTFHTRAGVECEEIELEVEFTLTGGHPGTAPSLSYPGDPPEPPEFEVVSVTLVETGETTALNEGEEDDVREAVFDDLGRYLDEADDDYPED